MSDARAAPSHVLVPSVAAASAAEARAMNSPEETPQKRRVLTDPRAIGALAHPARLAVLDALSYEDVCLTATECARLADVSPSAMSYHLRALEKWGFVERAPASEDGRQRPWRAASQGWSIDAIADAATATATTAVSTVVLNRVAGELGRWFGAEAEQPKAWREHSGLSNSIAWLSADELAELSRLLTGFLDERKGRTTADHPEGARRTRITHIVVPLQVS